MHTRHLRRAIVALPYGCVEWIEPQAEGRQAPQRIVAFSDYTGRVRLGGFSHSSSYDL
jgi:hypothetical protein